MPVTFSSLRPHSRRFAALRHDLGVTNPLDRPTDAAQASAMLYGAGAIATYLGMTEHACRHLIAESVIPTFKIGSRICARRESIDSWLCDQEARARVAMTQPTVHLVEDDWRRGRRARGRRP
jgi:hypothetical protein